VAMCVYLLILYNKSRVISLHSQNKTYHGQNKTYDGQNKTYHTLNT